jgi:rhodanese-related sulfurtransferase
MNWYSKGAAMTTTAGSTTISPAEVHRLCAGHAGFDLIDVRTPAEFEAVHAEGARLMPLERLDPQALLSTRRGAPADPVYLICRSGARAAKARDALAAAGCAGAVVVAGGTDAWVREGLPVVRGERAALPLERQVRIAAGLLVLLGIGLGWHVHPAFLALSAFVGAGLVFSGVTDWCGMGMLLARMPWNQRAGVNCASK